MIVSISLMFLAGLLNGVMDKIKHHWDDSVFSKITDPFWFKFFHKESWRNKYKFGWDNPKTLERNNVPITFTDAWHLAKSLMLWSICFSIGFCLTLPLEWIGDLIIFSVICRVAFGVGFTLTYKILL